MLHKNVQNKNKSAFFSTVLDNSTPSTFHHVTVVNTPLLYKLKGTRCISHTNRIRQSHYVKCMALYSQGFSGSPFSFQKYK